MIGTRGAAAPLAVSCLALCLFHATAKGAEAFITDQIGDEVSVLDLSSKHVVARIPVAGKPAGIAMAPDGRAAYVTSTEGKYRLGDRYRVAQGRRHDRDPRHAAWDRRQSGGRLYLCRGILSAAPL